MNRMICDTCGEFADHGARPVVGQGCQDTGCKGSYRESNMAPPMDFTETPLPWTSDGPMLLAKNGAMAGTMRSAELAEHVGEMLNGYQAIHDEAVTVITQLAQGKKLFDKILAAADVWERDPTGGTPAHAQVLANAVREFRAFVATQKR